MKGSRLLILSLAVGAIGGVWAVAPAAGAATIPTDSVSADVASPRNQTWGLGMAMRSTNIAFDTEDRTVATLVPLIMFENRYVFIRELEGGVHFLNRPTWEFNLISRAHFFDIPQDLQNQIQGDNLDTGLQFVYRPWSDWALAGEAMTDFGGRPSANVSAYYLHRYTHAHLRAGLRAKIKSSDYNSTYWGLDREEVDGGAELGAGARLFLQVWRNFYVVGAGTYTLLDKPVRDLEFVVDRSKWEAYAGLGFSDPIDRPRKVRLASNGYLRVGHMWATPSSLSKIIHGHAQPDPDNHQLTTVFYGHPLTDRLFGLPLEFFLHTGVGLHWKSPKQDHEMEFVVAIKMYYTIPLPVRLRVGAAEGVSWVTDVPAREKQNLTNKGYQTSQYLNYLDFSADLNLGDVTPGKKLDKLWVGYYIHHRSAVFKSAQQFGRIKGGSNFQAIYLQLHF